MTLNAVPSGKLVPTVANSLFQAGTISTELIGVYYVPAAEHDATGELDFGATDSAKATGDIAYVPVTSTSPASRYWGLNQTISYGGSSILSFTAGIVDTGTTLVLLATDAFKAYQSATGATLDDATGQLHTVVQMLHLADVLILRSFENLCKPIQLLVSPRLPHRLQNIFALC